MSDSDVIVEPHTKAHHRYAAVVKAAALVIYQKGYDAASMDEIADAANLTKAGLYYYTKGKQDLLYMIIKWAMDLVETHIVHPALTVDDPAERLREIVKNHLKLIMYGSGAVAILAIEADKLTVSHQRSIRKRNREYVGLVGQTLDELATSGKLRPVNTKIAGLNLFATFLGFARWYQANGEFAQDEIIGEVSSFVLGGLLADVT